MTGRPCSASTRSESTCTSPLTRSTPASPTWVNKPLVISSITNARGKIEKSIVLPSLCDQIEEPEAHPDFEAIMASLKERSPLLIIQNTPQPSRKNSSSTLKPMSTPNNRSTKLSGSTLPYYSSQNNTISEETRHLSARNVRPTHSIGQQPSTRKLPPFDISAPRPAIVYAVAEYHIKTARYVTNADPRGFLPVYEYQLHGHTLMIDMETSYVQLASIYNILGPSRANILRTIESSAELQPYVRKIEGGFLKIQGVWVPFSVARELARRLAWSIRFDLVPFFGYHFPTQCLSPNDPGFGDLRLSVGVRRSKRSKTTDKHNTQLTTISNRSERSSTSSEIGIKPENYWLEQSSDALRDNFQNVIGVVSPLKTFAPQASQSKALFPTSSQIFTSQASRKRMRDEAHT